MMGVASSNAFFADGELGLLDFGSASAPDPPLGCKINVSADTSTAGL